MLENWESEDKERLICRSLVVNKQIQNHEENLLRAFDTGDFHAVDKALSDCHGIDIDVKLRKRAEVLHLRLNHELKIKNFLNEKSHHDNYKDIRKDV